MSIHTYSTSPQGVDVLDVATGTIDSGDKTSLYREDGNTLVVNEVGGSPGFEVILTFDAIRALKYYANVLRINLVGYYDGNAGHDVKMYIWNWKTEAWDAMTGDAKDLPDETGPDNYSFQVFTDDQDNEYVSGERYKGFAGYDHEVRVMISHDSGGNAAHDLHLDHAYLDFIQVGTERHKQVIAHA